MRLPTVLIEDTRFTQAGLRQDGVFLGEGDHEGDPLPELIGARPQDLQPMVQGMIAVDERMREGAGDSVLQAAATVSVLSIYIRCRMATGTSTTVSSIMSWRRENSHRPAWCSRSPRSCLTGSTPTGIRYARILALL